MNMPFSFMRALGGYGGTQPLQKPPMMIRPYPGQTPGAPQPWQPQDLLEAEAPTYMPGGIRTPQMPDQGPDVKPPSAPAVPGMEDEEGGLGKRFLMALQQSIGRARTGSQDNEPFYLRRA